MDRNYIASERFIHDELLRRAEGGVSKIPDLWRTDKRIYPTILLWPSDTVRATDGTRFSGLIFRELSTDPAVRLSEIKVAKEKCDAYAVLLTEQLETDVRSIFESMHGTRTWRYPIRNHGDVQILGRPSIRDNAESVGVLWTAN